jgi:hypothetical protein
VIRTRLLLSGALLASTCLAMGAHADKPAPLADGPLGAPADVAAMLDLEAKMADSLQQSKAVPIEFGSAAQTPGDVVGTGGWGDSGLWTGVYLGGESLRYRTATAHLASLHGNGKPEADQVTFWTAQRDQAMSRIRVMLAGEHRDIDIAEDWNGSLKVPPSVSTNPCVQSTGLPGCDHHAADFGGGVIKGQRGMIMRACTLKGSDRMGVSAPAEYADHPVENNNNRVFEITWLKIHGGDGNTYDCETSPSRDTYAGLTFGLLTAYDMVGPDAPDLKKQIRQDLLDMGNFLLQYGWNYPRPHGYVSAKHDFDGFISPLFVYVPMARLNLTNAVRHVVDDGGAAADQQKWDAVWDEELATEGPQLAGSLQIDSAQPNDGYYKFNLHHLTSFNLLRTTTGPAHDLIAQAVSVMDKTTGDDINAHFEAIIYAMTGDPARRDAAILHLRQWRDYRANTSGGQVVDNAKNCPTITCVPQDRYELAVDAAPGGSVAWNPGTSSKLRAARPLPVALRPPTDFLWQRAPTDLNGSEGATQREPGIDYLTPYWMLRYYTEVVQPALQPLPTWAGPASY